MRDKKGPWYDNEFYSHANMTNFYNKGFARSLVLKVGTFGIRERRFRTKNLSRLSLAISICGHVKLVTVSEKQ